MVWDEATSPTSYGATWYTLERGYGLKFTPVSINALKNNFAKFDVIILPDGSISVYQNLFGKAGIDKLKEWVNNGGTLICLATAAVLPTIKDVGLSSSQLVSADGSETATQPAATPEPAASQTSTAPAKDAKQKPAKDKGVEKEKNTEVASTSAAKPVKKPTEPIELAGSSFLAKLDRKHYLTYGYDADSVVVMKSGDAFFRPSKEGANVVTFNADGQLTVAGFVWENNTEELLRGTSYLIDEPTGGGQVIMFAEDPNFRFLWRTTSQMFMNAVLLSPSLR
jgi:hypothetical protein